MGKGKAKVNDWDDSDHSSIRSNTGPVKKQKVIDYEKEIAKKKKEIAKKKKEVAYWKEAYFAQYRLNQEYRKWVRMEMENMVAKHRSQCLNLKNMAANNRAYFAQLIRGIMAQFEDAMRQVTDSMFGIESAAQDYIKGEFVPKFEGEGPSWRPPMIGGRVDVAEAHKYVGVIGDVTLSPVVPSRSMSNEVGMANAPVGGGGGEQQVRTPQCRVIPSGPPIQVHVTDDELAWVERQLEGLEDDGHDEEEEKSEEDLEDDPNYVKIRPGI